MSRAADTLLWSRSWIGFDETGTNVQPFDSMVGHAQDLAWCATFRVAAHRCTDAPIPSGGDSAYTPTNLRAYERAGLMLDLDRDTPEPGDVFWVTYASMLGTRYKGVGHEGQVLAHVGGSRIATIEGNANQAASRTGGQVASLTRDYRTRGTAWIAGIARPRWDGAAVVPVNLPTVAQHTGQLLAVPAASRVNPALVEPDGTLELIVDGQLGPQTISRWQRVMGTTIDGVISRPSELVKAVQRHLNGQLRSKLSVDGVLGPRTVRALQAYLGTPVDGVITGPSSVMVRALQARLNAGRF